MPYWRCEDEGGGADKEADAGKDSASNDSTSGDESSGEDSGDNDDSVSGDDYRSLLGLNDGSSENPYGLSLGADDYIAKIDQMAQDVDRYSPRDYADNYRDHGGRAPRVPEQRPMDVPYTGWPDKPLIKVNILPDKLQQLDVLLMPWLTLKMKFTEDDYGVGLQFGGSVGLDRTKDEGGNPAPLFELTGREGVFINFDKPEKSNVFDGLGIKTPAGGKELANGEYTVEQMLNDAKTIYDGALRAMGYPPSSPNSNPW